MAGIAEARGQIYCAHLQRMSLYGTKPCSNPGQKPPKGKRMIWSGLCEDDPDAKKSGYWYLADNLSWWDAEQRDVLFTPCYRSLPEKIGVLLDRVPKMSAVGWSCARALTMLKRLKNEGIDAIAQVNDDGLSPEVDLSFSKGDEFKHVHLSLYNVRSHETANHVFLIDPAVMGHDFDGHVTHVEHCGDGRIVCVNFLKRKLLIIDSKDIITPPTDV